MFLKGLLSLPCLTLTLYHTLSRTIRQPKLAIRARAQYRTKAADQPIEAATMNMKEDTPLQIEKAKVAALEAQVKRYKQENQRILELLKKTQHDLEKQTKDTLALQHQHIEKEKARERQAISSSKVERDEMQKLREELLTAQRDLTKQLSLSKQREQEHEKKLDRMKRQFEQQKNDANNDEQQLRRTNNLERCQSELLVLVKKQMKLIEILKEQRNHARAAVLLGITEKTFLKEVTAFRLR